MLIGLVVIGAAAAAHMAPFPFLLEAFRPSRSLWHLRGAPGTPPTLYFALDDGPNAQWTPPLLDALRETKARATFFLIETISLSSGPESIQITFEPKDADGYVLFRPSSVLRLVSIAR